MGNVTYEAREVNIKYVVLFFKKKDKNFSKLRKDNIGHGNNLREEVLEEGADVGCDGHRMLRESPPGDDTLERQANVLVRHEEVHKHRLDRR